MQSTTAWLHAQYTVINPHSTLADASQL